MVISPVRQHSPIALVIIPVLAAILWTPAFIDPVPPPQLVEMPLYGLLDGFFRNYRFLAVIIGFLLLLGEGFLLNYILQHHQVITKKNWLPALLVVVFGSCTPGLLWPSSQQFGGIIMLVVLNILLGTYRQDKALSAVFNSGILLGIASQLYLPTLIFFLFCFIAVLMLRPFIWREWAMLLIGVLLPFIYGGVYFFWTDTYNEITSTAILDPVINRDFFFKLSSADYFLAGMTVLILLVSSGRLVAGSLTSTLKTKKGVSVLLWFLLFSLIAVIPAQNFAVGSFRYIIYPFAFLASNYFLFARRIWLAEVIFTLLLAGIGVSYLVESGFTL